MSLDYNMLETLNLLKIVFKYNIFYSIILTSILLVVILIINRNKKFTKYIVFGINIVLIILINYYYLEEILTFKFHKPINNIYFYFFNSVIYLIIMSIINFKNKYKHINYIFYGLIFINLLYSLFMTHYLNNINLIVIGNIYPMIKIGNIIYIIYYTLVIICFIENRFLTKKI